MSWWISPRNASLNACMSVLVTSSDAGWCGSSSMTVDVGLVPIAFIWAYYDPLWRDKKDAVQPTKEASQ